MDRLAADLWKSDCADLAASMRLRFCLRHEPLEQARRDKEEAIELGQRLMWRPVAPRAVGSRSMAKGPAGKAKQADVAVDHDHPATLVLKLEGTVAGCDWLLATWGNLRPKLEIDGLWSMVDVLQMTRLLGKPAFELADDLQASRLVLASVVLVRAVDLGGREKTAKLEPRFHSRELFQEWLQACVEHEGRLKHQAEMNRLWEPFAQALMRMPLDRLPAESESSARRRLISVVDEEMGRITRIRDDLQAIADADAAEAPARLAYEAGMEADRGRRYVQAYERLLNRRIDLFLKVRKSSGAGELDIAELEQAVGKDTSEQFRESPAGEPLGASGEAATPGARLRGGLDPGHPVLADSPGAQDKEALQADDESEAGVPGARRQSQLDRGHPCLAESTAAQDEEALQADDESEAGVPGARPRGGLDPGHPGQLDAALSEQPDSIHARPTAGQKKPGAAGRAQEQPSDSGRAQEQPGDPGRAPRGGAPGAEAVASEMIISTSDDPGAGARGRAPRGVAPGATTVASEVDALTDNPDAKADAVEALAVGRPAMAATHGSRPLFTPEQELYNERLRRYWALKESSRSISGEPAAT